ncbi:hypothetical protein E1258_28320 [Micromonospora sp. KC207]|uniref:hypothetical protein n=1 Tax=Micromonospora sp. KC207 TaxID=2530377 RepID=UPI00104AFB10|nr:hypothetical protein [Micromonospora sp. KC207]TDC47819.1 hypothetical protein E1258_28320 [Micromonospora sp. KC207]
MSTAVADFPVSIQAIDEDVISAVHPNVPESWPEGAQYRSERVPNPCRLPRWGQAMPEHGEQA